MGPSSTAVAKSRPSTLEGVCCVAFAWPSRLRGVCPPVVLAWRLRSALYLPTCWLDYGQPRHPICTFRTFGLKHQVVHPTGFSAAPWLPWGVLEPGCMAAPRPSVAPHLLPRPPAALLDAATPAASSSDPWPTALTASAADRLGHGTQQKLTPPSSSRTWTGLPLVQRASLRRRLWSGCKDIATRLRLRGSGDGF